jgi:membrane protein YdbS with pleckstrin-like domain
MSNKNKYLITGSVLFFIGVLFEIYFEFFYPSVGYIIKIAFRLILSLGTFLLFYQVSKSKFLKGLFFILFSVFFCVSLWTIYEGGSWGNEFVVIGAGVPSGLISGVLFLISNYYFKLNEKKESKYVKQVLLYFFILLFVSVLFKYGGDVL